MGVRIDHEGVVKRDFHTAGGTHRRGDEYGVAKANRNKPQTVVSERYYLADADFLVGLESEDLDLLHRLKSALAAPRWQLFLGRKSFVPGIPINVPGGLVNAALRDALTAIPWTPRGDSDPPQRLRLVLEVGTDVEAEVRSDVPLSFAERRFTIRFVLQDQILTPKGDASCISPD
jgi:CRISPR system Cascade subunit CasD